MNHPDFRAGNGTIFATLGYPDRSWGMVSLTPEQQGEIVQEWPAIFTPVKGGWGARGATNVRLASAETATLRDVMKLAWTNATAKATRKPASKRR
jgi:hypothetical protein